MSGKRKETSFERFDRSLEKLVELATPLIDRMILQLETSRKMNELVGRIEAALDSGEGLTLSPDEVRTVALMLAALSQGGRKS